MSDKNLDKSLCKKGSVRIAASIGRVHDVTAAAPEYNGTVESVLRQLADKHITDPGLRELLADPSSVYELYSVTPDGQSEERPLSPNTSWDEIIRKAMEADVEVGIARAHKGGRS